MRFIKNKYLVIFVFTLVVFSNKVMAKDDIAYLALHNDYWQVWLMDADGKNARPITKTEYDKSRISWYPDGNLLVNGNQGELVKLSLKDLTETKIPIPFEFVNDAVISPDGKYIAFSQKPEGSIYNKMWLLNVVTGEKKKVNWEKGFQHEPNFSLDSNILYFLSGDNGQTHDIKSYNIKTKNVKPVTMAKLYNFDVVAGKNNSLAFSSNRGGNYDIWINSNGKFKKITNHPALDARPSWSLDGKTVYFESNRGGSLNIWSVNIDDPEQLQQITQHKDGARYPLWKIK